MNTLRDVILREAKKNACSTLHDSKATECKTVVSLDTAWVLPLPSKSWIILIIWLYIALNRAPNKDCYWVGAVPKIQPNCKGEWSL